MKKHLSLKYHLLIITLFSEIRNPLEVLSIICSKEACAENIQKIPPQAHTILELLARMSQIRQQRFKLPHTPENKHHEQILDTQSDLCVELIQKIVNGEPPILEEKIGDKVRWRVEWGNMTQDDIGEDFIDEGTAEEPKKKHLPSLSNVNVK